MRISKKWIVCVLVVSQLFTACGILPKEEEFQVAPIVGEFKGANYVKIKVKRGDLVKAEKVLVYYNGTKVSELRNRYMLVVKKVHVKKGTKVKEGDLLVSYYVESAELKYDEANYNSKTTQMNIRHQKELLKIEIDKQKKVGGSKKSIQSIKEAYDANIKQEESKLKIYKLEMKEAKNELKEFDLRADLSGTITYLNAGKEGEFIKNEDVAVRIEGASKNRFEATTKYASYFKDGSTTNISITRDSYEAKVQHSLKNKNRIYLYMQSKATQFNDEQVGEVTCVLGQKKNVLYVPNGIIYKMGDKDIVYMEDESGMKKAVEIKRGEIFDNLVEIVSGLKEGDEVITN